MVAAQALTSRRKLAGVVLGMANPSKVVALQKEWRVLVNLGHPLG